MRVSDLQRYNAFQSDVQQRLQSLLRIEQEIGTGRSLQAPSEDVAKASQALRADTALAENKQYVRNIDDGLLWVNSADGTLQTIVDLINEIDTLALSTDNDNQNEQDRQNAAIVLDQKIEALMELVNDTNGSRYIFGGYSTTAAPFTAERDESGRIISVSANEDTIGGEIYRRIDRSDDVQINVNGDRLFQPAGEAGTDSDLFYVVVALRDTIANNNQPPEGSGDERSNPHLREQLDVIRNRITGQQSYLGSLQQRMQMTRDRLLEEEVDLTDMLDQAEGADMTDLASRLAVEESVYNSLLAIQSKLLTTSLVDYLL